MDSALLTVAVVVSVILAAVIAVQRVKYKNLVQQTNQSMKDLQEKERMLSFPFPRQLLQKEGDRLISFFFFDTSSRMIEKSMTTIGDFRKLS